MGRMLENLGRSLSYGKLSLKAKVLWPMLLSSVDDQGRHLADADAIKWSVCQNVNEITVEEIPGLLSEMATQRMIHLYTNSDTQLLQITKWWCYQSGGWFGPSRYPPPAGWIDRERYHAEERKIVTRNWDKQGGFTALDNGLPSPLPSPLPSDKTSEEGDVKDEGKGNLSAETEKSSTSSKKKPPTNRQALFAALVRITGWDASLKRGRLNKSVARLDKADPPYTANDLDVAERYWYAHDWRGKKGQKPAPEHLEEIIKQALAAPDDETPIDFEEYRTGEYSDVFGEG